VPFNLPLPASLRQARWKVKIREKESREPPHVTILRGALAWRIDLRTGEFMDDQPDPPEVPDAILALIRADETWRLLCEEWNQMYPTNPVGADTSDEE
jgi:hypothetical protein